MFKITTGVMAQHEHVVNQRIIYYMDSVIGTRVGDGVCWKFVQEAMVFANPKWAEHKDSSCGCPVYGREVNYSDIEEGDVVVYKYYNSKREEIPGHVAIVCDVFQGGYMIADQNHGVLFLKRSRVRQHIGDMKSESHFYRPFKP